MTLTREEIERLRTLSNAFDGTRTITLFDPKVLLELLRGYDAWRDGIEALKRKITAAESLPATSFRLGFLTASAETLDSLKGSKEES